MNLYSIALFFHVVGALGFFIALGLEWVNLKQLQRATTVEELKTAFGYGRSMRGLAGISMLIILIAGFYMTFAAWGGADWIAVAFGVMIVQGIVAGVLTSPRMKALGKGMEGESGPLSPTLTRLQLHPLLGVSMWTRIGMGLAIIFLMTVKPALMGALIAVAVAIVLGLAVAFFTTSSRRSQPVAA